MAKVVAIIQARIGSTRLPGKVLKPILREPMLARMLERVKRAKEIERVIVATSEKSRDDDVLDRMYRAAKDASADVIVGLTGDCPLHDPGVIDEAVRHFIAANNPF